jgi:transposase
MELCCKRCGSEEHVKNGWMRGKQRYRCKACGLNFTDTPPRGKPLALKVAAVLLYVSGLSMNRTAKLLGVSTPTIQAWLEQFAAAYAQKPEPEGRAVVIELDEMWHYLKKTRSAKLAGTLAVPRRPGRHPGRGGSGCAGSGHAAGGQDAGGVRSIAPG